MKLTGRERRHARITKKLQGDDDKLRLVVKRSNKHMYSQLVDDLKGQIKVSMSTLSPEFRDLKIKTTNVEAAKQVGILLAKKAQKNGINEIRFDRAGYKYHGRVKALADGAREGGLKF